MVSVLSFVRCFFIAQSYVLVKKWSEALVLYERVLKYAKEVQSKAKNLNNSLKVGDRSSTVKMIRAVVLTACCWTSSVTVEDVSVSAGSP